jgi:hypothetical protein
VDIEEKDEAERIADRMRTRRNRLLDRCYWGVLIALVGFAGLQWMFGITYGRWSEWLVAVVVIGLPAVGLLNALGVFDHHAELRYRTKQINQRLTAIESTLNSRMDELQKKLNEKTP